MTALVRFPRKKSSQRIVLTVILIVAWHCVPPQPIDKVVPHQNEASFAVFHSPTIVDDERRTTVSIFQALSSTPTTIRTLPFGLRNAIWASFSSGSGFNLVGITHSWRVVTFGDSRQTLKDEGRTATAMNIQSQPTKRTLFEDIFGVSAFASTSSDSVQAPALLHKNSKSHDVFDTPVYLAPSLDDLFNPLIKSFLTLRPAEPSIADDADDGEEDIVMEEEQDPISPTSRHASRVPNAGEMDAFTKLFRSRCMTGRNLRLLGNS